MMVNPPKFEKGECVYVVYPPEELNRFSPEFIIFNSEDEFSISYSYFSYSIKEYIYVMKDVPGVYVRESWLRSVKKVRKLEPDEFYQKLAQEIDTALENKDQKAFELLSARYAIVRSGWNC